MGVAEGYAKMVEQELEFFWWLMNLRSNGLALPENDS